MTETVTHFCAQAYVAIIFSCQYMSKENSISKLRRGIYANSWVNLWSADCHQTSEFCRAPYDTFHRIERQTGPSQCCIFTSAVANGKSAVTKAKAPTRWEGVDICLWNCPAGRGHMTNIGSYLAKHSSHFGSWRTAPNDVYAAVHSTPFHLKGRLCHSTNYQLQDCRREAVRKGDRPVFGRILTNEDKDKTHEILMMRT